MDTSKEYVLMCDSAQEIQKLWQPATGQYVFRKHTVFGEEIDEKMWGQEKLVEIVILTFQSSIDGYFHATNLKGETRLFNSSKDLYKETCVWIPTQSDLQKIYRNSNKDLEKVIGIHSMSSDFDRWQNKNTKPGDVSSMEQLWLWFIMYNVFGKTWNHKKNKWEKIKKLATSKTK